MFPNEIQNSNLDRTLLINDGEVRDAVRHIYSRKNLAVNSVAITGTTTLDPRYSLMLCSTSGSAYTITLPAASYWGTNKSPLLTFVHSSGTNGISLAVSGSDTVVYAADGGTGDANLRPSGKTILVSDGVSKWYVVEESARSTWTPAISAATPGNLAVGYTTQWGEWIVDNREVTCYAYILTSSFTHTTASGTIQITGLPFTSVNVSGARYVGSLYVSGWTRAGYTMLTPIVFENSTVIRFVNSGTGVGSEDTSITHFPTGGTVNLGIAIKYRTA